MFSKFNYVRDKAHLNRVASLPCQLCGLEGQTQAAHSNQAKHGKGRGVKASDEFTAALCQECHSQIDQGKGLLKQGRIDLWEFAYKNTLEALKKSV